MRNLFTTLDLETLTSAARVAVGDSLDVQSGERVLIVTNPSKQVYEVAMALYNAAAEKGAETVLIVQPVKSQLDFADDAVIDAISSEPDVFISISAHKLGKDRFAVAHPYTFEGKSYDHVFRYLLASRRLRAFWSPNIDADMFTRTVPIDYDRLRGEAEAVRDVLDACEEVHISSPAGTDLRMGLRHRKPFTDDGNLSEPGKGGNLPAGETFISPQIGACEGTIVFDGSLALSEGDVVANTPVRVTVEDGYVVDIDDNQTGRKLLDTISESESNALRFEREGMLPKGSGAAYRRNARGMGELGIGLNPNARVTGNMLEDEKAYGTCHIAIGSNYDQDAPSLTHLDCLVREPTMVALMRDDSRRTFMQDGKLLIAPKLA